MNKRGKIIMEILIFILTIIIGFIGEIMCMQFLKYPGIGPIFAAAFIGSIILWEIRKKDK